MISSRTLRATLVSIAFALTTFPALAQVSMTTIGSPIATQTFDNPPTIMPTTGSATWTNNSTVAGWYHARTGTGTTVVADGGTGTGGNLYSYGTGTGADRALGSIGSGNAAAGNFFWGIRLQNNTGATITSLDVSYVGEQWRKSGVVVAQTIAFSYLVGSPTVSGTLAEFQSAGVPVTQLDFASPVNTATAAALDGNAAANRTAISFSITGLSIPNGTEIMLRWSDPDHTGADHGLAIDGVVVTPQGAAGNAAIVPTCPTPVTTTAGTATSQGVSATDADGTVTSATITGITPSNPGTITLTGFTPAGAVGGTANATLSVSNATPAGTYGVTIQWANDDGVPQTASCVVSVVVNAAPSIVFIHDVQGNGAATPIPGATVTVEGVVTGDFQPISSDNRLSGFFLQEETTDFDANAATSEGIFIFCNTCPTDVAEGQRVQVTGTVSEFNNSTQITASTAGSVVITNAGNNLAQVTAATIDLPIVGVINDYYEARESMLVTYSDTLTVSEYFEQARYGRVELFEGARPRQFTQFNPPSAAGYAAHLAALDRRRVYLDDDDNVENSVLLFPDGQEAIFHPRANGGLSVGTQGTDFFRGGDQVTGLTGVLHWSFSGGTSPDEWRIRPAAATPATFTVANPRPATPPAVGGAIRAASVNVLNYFTTLNQRGADSTAELNRQRERTSIVLCDLDADVATLMEIENHPTNATITDLLGAVNARCGGTQPYTFVNTGGALGTDQIRVLLIYRTGVLSPVGAAQSDMDSVHNRPPTAQTFDVVDASNPAFGERFTALANHSKSKGGCPGSGADTDQGDGQSCFAVTRVNQANRILTFVNGTVIPAAGDPDVLLLGDFNSNAQETATTTITGGGYTDLATAFQGAAAYSYLFDGQIGHLDYAFSSASLTPQITGANAWHINADENPLFDYNDEIDDGAAEAAFEEKPDGSALVPPRVLFQPASAYRASDHDPIILGIFAISDLVVTKADSPDPVTAGNNLTYTITVTNNGPDPAASAAWSDTLPAGTTFVSMPANTGVGGWTCSTGATVSCTNPSFAVGSSVFTLTVAVDPSVAAGTVLSNTATATSASMEANAGDESDTETTTVAASANLSVTKTDTPDPVNAGGNITYTITVNNAGPSNASTVSLSDTLPAGTTFVSLSSPGGWSCNSLTVGSGGTLTCTNGSMAVGSAAFTLIVAVDPSTAAGAVITNTANVTSATSDPSTGDESGVSTTTVAASADLSVTKTDSPDPVTAGNNLTYTITANNAGPSNASTVSLTDTLPAGTTFVSLASPGGWSCNSLTVGAGGTLTCTNTSMAVGNAVFTLVVAVDPSTAAGTVINNSATVASAVTPDPNSGNETGTSATTVAASADLQLSKTDSPDPVNAGSNLSYTITLTNNGPSNAASATFTDTLPADTTFVSLSTTGPWSCTTPGVGTTGTVSCTNPSFGVTVDFFTLVVNVGQYVTAGTVLSNTATLASSTTDPNGANNSATATTTVATSSDVQITKVDTPDPVTAGSNISYTINVANVGPSDSTGVTFADTIPANTTFVSLATYADFTCSTPAVGGTGLISCSKPSTLLAGASGNFTLVVMVNPATAAGTIITNTGSVASTTSDPNSANNSATATTTVATSAELSVTKVDTPDPVTAGTNLTYTVTVNNAGPSNASTVSLTDTVPANTTFVSLSNPGGWSCSTPAVGGTGLITCTNATMAPGNAVFTLVVNVNAGTADGTVITNSATVASTTSDPNSGNETGTATTTVGVGSADISVTKVDTPDPVTGGSNLTYTITVNNAGPSNATSATLSDPLPTGTTFVSLSSPAGWICTPPAVGASGTVTCTAASLAIGSSVFTLTVHVDPALVAGTILSNTVTAGSATTDPNTGNESDTETTAVLTSADLSVTKTDSPDPVTAGTNLTYAIAVNNAGPTFAAGVTLAESTPANTTFVSMTAPAGWSCTTPAAGGTGAISCTNASLALGTANFTLIVNVNSSTPAATTLSNTATVSSTTPDPNSGNESDTETTATTLAVTSADLSVTKVDTPDPVNAGSNLTYTITVTNAGPDAALNANFSDPLPASTSWVSVTGPGWNCALIAGGPSGTVICSNPSVAVGSSVITLVVAVDATAAAGTTLTNTASVSSENTPDPVPGNQSATATTTVLSPATLSATKTVSSVGGFQPGTSVIYTIVITNNGPSTQADNPGNELVDILPAELDLLSASANTGTAVATIATNTVTWNGSLPAGGTATITIFAAIDPATAPGTTINNQGTVNFDADGNGTNESARPTDSPAAAGASDPTTFTVAAPAGPPATDLTTIPTLDEYALLALAALLGVVAMMVMKR